MKTLTKPKKFNQVSQNTLPPVSIAQYKTHLHFLEIVVYHAELVNLAKPHTTAVGELSASSGSMLPRQLGGKYIGNIPRLKSKPVNYQNSYLISI